MRKFIVTLVLAGAALLSGSASLLAHHGAATFDTEAPITLKGTVVEWLWVNPHSILRFDVKAEDGSTKTWSAATGNVADASKRGWSRRSFTVGEEVSVTLQPAKSGAPVGVIEYVVFADGHKLEY